MLTFRVFVFLVFLVSFVACNVKHDFSSDKPDHRFRHRHEYYRHIREYLRRRRARLRGMGMKVYVANTEEHVKPEPEPKEPTVTALPVYEPKTTPSTRKSIQKLKHYFYPKEPVNKKIDEIRKTEAEELAKKQQLKTTTTTPVPTEVPEPEVHEPDPDALLRGLGKSEKEIEHFHQVKNSDFLHHHLTSNQTPPSADKSRIPDRQIQLKPPEMKSEEPIESIEKLEKEFRYDSESPLPILDRPLFEVPDTESGENFKPVALPSGFRHYDIDQDGYVSKDELVLITGAEENVDYVFKLADADGDSLLSRREFHHAPWRLDGDPDKNAEVDQILADLQSELRAKASKLQLEYVPRVTVKQATSRDQRGKLTSRDQSGKLTSRNQGGKLRSRDLGKLESESEEADGVLADNGKHPDPLGLWYSDDGTS